MLVVIKRTHIKMNVTYSIMLPADSVSIEYINEVLTDSDYITSISIE